MDENILNNQIGIAEEPADGNAEQTERITVDDIRNAYQKLQKFKKAKASVDGRIIDNEEWFRQRHWKFMKDSENNGGGKTKSDITEPTSAWMFNSLFNKHADAMDNYPTCNFLPREESDRHTAEELSAIVPVILKLNNHKKLYRRSWWYLLKFGTVVEGTFWDKNKYYGMGDITMSRIDILNFFPDPDVLDIQDSSDIFYVHLKNTEALKKEYPEIDDNNLRSTFRLERYIHDDSEDLSDRTAVIDWYYKRQTENGTVVHYCKFVGEQILYASENTPEYCDRGFYDHGEYPFDVIQLFPVETSIFSFGFIDIMRSPQAYIDRLDQAILTNAAMMSKPRALISKQAGVNIEDLADLTKDFIEVSGHIDSNTYQPLQAGTMPSFVINHYLNKINELKETSGNRDVNQGSAGSVTSGTAIAALQESGSKGSRDILQGYYDCFESQCKKIVALITQFYDMPRKFRITNKQGQEEFVEFSNAQLVPQQVTGSDGLPNQIMNSFGDMQPEMRIPEFDVDIVAQKQNRFTTNANNEMALSFYSAGFFNPQNADQAAACLEMMQFDSKEQILTRIQQNGMMYQQMLQMQQQIVALSQIVAQITGDTRVLQAANAQLSGQSVAKGSAQVNIDNTMSAGSDNSQAAKARRQAMEAASV